MKTIKLFAKLLVIVWFSEMAIMLSFSLLPAMSGFTEAIIDATSLAIILIFPIWKLVISPIIKKNINRQT